MSIIMQEEVTAVTNWLHNELWPELQLLYANNPYLKYLLILLVVLIWIIKLCRKKTETHTTSNERTSAYEPKGGYRNFKGDKWYPDGRVWNKKKSSWENPDYSKRENE